MNMFKFFLVVVMLAALEGCAQSGTSSMVGTWECYSESEISEYLFHRIEINKDGEFIYSLYCEDSPGKPLQIMVSLSGVVDYDKKLLVYSTPLIGGGNTNRYERKGSLLILISDYEGLEERGAFKKVRSSDISAILGNVKPNEKWLHEQTDD